MAVAVLSDEERRRVWAHMMRQAAVPVIKSEFRAAVDATDAWIDANQASFNSGLPQPFRGAADIQTKTLLFCLVAMRRAGLLHTAEDGR